MTYRMLRNLALLAAILVVVTPAGPVAGATPRAVAASTPDCGPTVYKTHFSRWVCTFADDFSGTSLDRAKWSVITTAANGMTGGGACFVDSPNNISVSGGYLNLTVRREAAPFTCASPKGNFTTDYSSGQVATYGKFAQMYGRFAVRAKFPAATVAGLQSSLWMWPQYGPSTGLIGEIDIAEEYSIYPDRAIPYLHYAYDPSTVNPLTGVNVVTNNYCMINDVNAFHQYVVQWTPTTFTIIYDGRTCLVDRYEPLGTDPFQQPYFIALTQGLGIGANAYDPTRILLPATTQIDWVRIWK